MSYENSLLLFKLLKLVRALSIQQLSKKSIFVAMFTMNLFKKLILSIILYNYLLFWRGHAFIIVHVLFYLLLCLIDTLRILGIFLFALQIEIIMGLFLGYASLFAKKLYKVDLDFDFTIISSM
jgi:hypothetical protein